MAFWTNLESLRVNKSYEYSVTLGSNSTKSESVISVTCPKATVEVYQDSAYGSTRYSTGPAKWDPISITFANTVIKVDGKLDIPEVARQFYNVVIASPSLLLDGDKAKVFNTLQNQLAAVEEGKRIGEDQTQRSWTDVNHFTTKDGQISTSPQKKRNIDKILIEVYYNNVMEGQWVCFNCRPISFEMSEMSYKNDEITTVTAQFQYDSAIWASANGEALGIL